MAQNGSYESVFILKDKVSEKLDGISKKAQKVSDKTKKAKVQVKGFQGVLQRLNGTLKGASVQLEHYAKKIENITKAGKKLQDIGKNLTIGVTLPVIAAGGAMVKLASDMEETINKVDVSFGKSSDTVKEWAKNSITSMGLAQQSALDSAALYGDMATGMGMAQDKAADMAMSLTQLGADLASFKNISNDMAQTALKSIFTGETESLKNLGIVMTENNLTRFAASKGIKKQMKDMSDLEKIQLRYNYVMSQTVNAQGDFIRTGGGAANQTRMFQEQIKELGVTFGQYLLPYFTKAMKKLNELIKAFNNLSPKTKKTILIIAGIAAAIGPLITVLGGLITGIGALNVALGFLAANPIVLIIAGVIAAIAALTAGVIYCYNHFEGFRKMCDGLGAVIKLVGSLIRLHFIVMFEGLKIVISTVVDWFHKLMDIFNNLPGPVKVLGNVLMTALFTPLKLIWNVIKLVVAGLEKVGGFSGLGDAIKNAADTARGRVNNITRTVTTNDNRNYGGNTFNISPKSGIDIAAILKQSGYAIS